jgi:thioredoxin 1
MLNKAENMNVKGNEAPIALLGEASFDAEVLQSKQPVLVAFWAPWSRACQVLDSVLQELASALDGKARVVKVNADDSLDLSILYDIHSIPTLLYFVEGTPRLRIVGTATQEAILAKLKPFGVTSETVE